MRVRIRSVHYASGATPASLERFYRELSDSLVRGGQSYPYVQPGAVLWRPPLDIQETTEAILIKMELAGVPEDAIDVTLYDNALVVSGHRDEDAVADDVICYHEAQIRYGHFRAEVLLRYPIEYDQMETAYHHGFLRIRLPKQTLADSDALDTSDTPTPHSIHQPHGGAQTTPPAHSGAQSVIVVGWQGRLR